ncbi:MAG: DUF4369 domain-containing protein [Bacteroidota bacterium]
MRKIGFLLVIGLLLAACGNQTNTYQISGTIDGVNEGSAVLKKIESSGPVNVDSTQIEDNSFAFSGEIEYPELYLVYVNDNQMPVAFFLESGDIQIDADIENMQEADVEGSELNEKFQEFNDEVPSNDRAQELQDEFMEARQGDDQETMQELAQEYQGIMEEQQKYYEEFVENNTDNAVGAFLAMNMAQSLEVEKLEELLSSFEDNLEGHPYVDEMKNLLESKKEQPQQPMQQPQQQGGQQQGGQQQGGQQQGGQQQGGGAQQPQQ